VEQKRKRESEKGKRKCNREVTMIKVYYMHVWKCHDEPLLYDILLLRRGRI
jgi:hypothetical protein